jgi:hypothetical protein
VPPEHEESDKEDDMKLRRQRRTAITHTTATANARKAPRRAGHLAVQEPWSAARVNETHARGISKIRHVLAEKGASLVPGSPLQEYVVTLAALSDDALVAAICQEQTTSRLRIGCPTLESLAAFAVRQRPVTHPVWQHALTCDACMRQILAVAGTGRPDEATTRSTRRRRSH